MTLIWLIEFQTMSSFSHLHKYQLFTIYVALEIVIPYIYCDTVNRSRLWTTRERNIYTHLLLLGNDLRANHRK